tara:strand:- start:22488 stop:22853 length:366 start_codon:yes stop_codon:yes gene_type:complete
MTTTKMFWLRKGEFPAPRYTGMTRQLGVALLFTLCLGLGAASSVFSPPAAAQPAAAATVNINGADVQTLAKGLSGVGQARATEIVRHREAYGPFASIEELTEVKGISTATLEKNRAVITLE